MRGIYGALARRNVASYIGREELNPEPEFTALAFFKSTLVLFKEWSLFVASDQTRPNLSRDHQLATLEVAYVPA